MNALDRNAFDAPTPPEVGGTGPARVPGEDLDALLDALPLGLFVVDGDRRLTRFNDAFLRRTGLDRAEALGRTCRQVLRCTYCGGACPTDAVRASGAPVRGATVEVGGPQDRREALAIDAAPLGQGCVVLWMREGRPRTEGAAPPRVPAHGPRPAPSSPGTDDERVRAALRRAAGSPTLAARLLGVHRTTLWRWMVDRGLRRSDFLPS